MRLITILLITLFAINNCQATKFTFHTAGSFTNPANWDTYPGSNLFVNDTISIEANCENIYLFAFDGYIVFEANVSSVGIDDFYVSDGCQLEFKSNSFFMDIGVSFTHTAIFPIIIPDFSFIELSNSGFGISSNTCIFDTYVDIYYLNLGSQEALLLECMEGSFTNLGTIDVTFPSFYLNCTLELEGGTIEGQVPFNFHQFNGAIFQYCSWCEATINNIENLYLNSSTVLHGSLTLNAPDE